MTETESTSIEGIEVLGTYVGESFHRIIQFPASSVVSLLVLPLAQ